MQRSAVLKNSPPSLRPYQEKAADFIYERNQSFITAWMGGGKTAIALAAFNDLLADGVVNRILVLSGRNICTFVWPEEIEKWTPSLDYAVAVGDPKKRRAALLGKAQIVTLNLENVTWAIREGLLSGFDALILDESTKLKDSTTQRFKALKRILKQFKIRVALSGTPISQGLLEFWSQAYLLDFGKRLDTSYYRFRARYFHSVDPNGWMWVPDAGVLELITKKMSDIVFVVENDEYKSQLPEFTSIDVELELDPKVRRSYRKLKDDYVLWLRRDRKEALEVDAGSGGVLSNKLRQISSGFLYEEDGETPHWLTQNKLDAYEDLIEQLGGQHALVAYQYRAELYAMLERVPGPYLGSGVSERKARNTIRDWNAGKVPVLYLHPASAGHGLNLQHGGHNIVWFSLPWSLEHFQQTRARIHRSGQAMPVQEHILVTRDTIDGKVATALRNRMTVQTAVMKALTD